MLEMIAWMLIGGLLLAGYLLCGNCALDTERQMCATALERIDYNLWLGQNEWARWAWPYVVFFKPWRHE